MSNKDSICCIQNIESYATRLLWEITMACNLECDFCMRSHSLHGNPPLSEIKEIYNKIQNSFAIDNIILTGGEPLLRDDFFDILEFFHSQNQKIAICTNATLIDTAVAKKLADNTVKVSVSLDSDNPQFHDKLRAADQSFLRTLDGIKTLLQENVNVNIIALLNKETLPYVMDLVHMVAQLKISAISFAGELPISAERSKYALWDLPQNELRGLFNVLRTNYPHLKIHTKSMFDKQGYVVCEAGNRVLGINADSLLLPCLVYKECAGIDILSHSSKEIREYLLNFRASHHKWNQCLEIERLKEQYGVDKGDPVNTGA